MLKMFFSLMIMMMSVYMYFLNHPLSLGLMIIFQIFLTCLLSGMLINTYWFSYILFLTFIGGLLVMFIYVSSIASNEMFNMSTFNKIYFMMIFMICFIISLMFMNKLNWMNFSMNYEMNNLINTFLFFNNENKINLSKLYNEQTYMMMMMLIIYLFISLVAIVKITNIFFGPLRSNI